MLLIGQEAIKKDLEMQVNTSIATNNILEPVFFGGGYGLGKTTAAYWLCQLIQQKLGSDVSFIKTLGGELSNVDDLYYFIADIPLRPTYKIRFIDEAHAVNRKMVATFNQFMDSLKDGMEIRGKTHSPCTFIFATEFKERIQSSLLSRFTHSYTLKYYTKEELVEVMQFHVDKLKDKFDFQYEITDEALMFISERSRRIARFAVNYLTRCLKEAKEMDRLLDKSMAETHFQRNLIGSYGLFPQEQAMLYHLYIMTTKEQTGKIHPLSAIRLAEQLNMKREEITKMYEPYLNSKHFIEIVTGGRILTPLGVAFVEKEKTVLKEIYNKWTSGELI